MAREAATTVTTAEVDVWVIDGERAIPALLASWGRLGGSLRAGPPGPSDTGRASGVTSLAGAAAADPD